jgi:hypothetical protein
MSTQIEEGNEEGVKDPDDNLIDSLIDDVHFDDLVLEKNVADVDQIEVFCTYYLKHVDKAEFKDIRKYCEFQIFDMICVCAWESVSSSDQSFKNDIKWGALVIHNDNIVANYPLKQWWRVFLMQYLPASKIPVGVFEIANEFRETANISKTWKTRNKTKIDGSTEPEIRVLYFGYKIEETTKKAISAIGMQYNRLYRAPSELPSGTNNMSPLCLAIKNCLFSVEKKALYLQKRRRQFYREKDASMPKLTKTYLMDGFEEYLTKAKSSTIIEDFFPKHWLCSLPINDRFKKGLYVSPVVICIIVFNYTYYRG